MTDPTRSRIAPFGSWVSPVTADLIVGESIRLGQVAIDGDTLYWTEGRPREQGRNVLVAHTADGTVADVSPAPFNVRTRAHEYGGGAFTVAHGEVVISHDADQQLYRLGTAGAPEALTRSTGKRYADSVIDTQRQLLITVREDHGSGAPEAVNALVAIDLQTGAERVIAGGHDFFSNPRLSPDGQQLAWLTWDHPNMPWDGTELWLAPVAGDGSLGPAQRVAGGKAESIFQPSWSPQGELHFVSDRSGWWNLYRQRGGATQVLLPMEAEFGEAQWVFGMSTYGFDKGSDQSGRVVCTCVRDGDSRLYAIEPETLAVSEIATPFRVIRDLQVGDGFAAFVGGSARAPEAVIRLDLASGAHTVIRSASSAVPDAAYTSVAEAITFPTEGGLTAHAFHYPPANADFRGPEGEQPPLIVMSHGGPTGATTAAFEWKIQYWTSRGFAVVDVNYGGSEGYGRAYRQRLAGLWGVVDVDDCVNAARYLLARGAANAARVAIRGGSAGGYTTLCALTFRSFFGAGASHYGIGDLEALARDTHKFESRYLDGLIGPYPTQRALYLERSPVNHTDRLASPMILFQGNEDKAVPPNQAQAMYDAVRAKGLPVAYLLFEGEQHGFRRADTIKRVLEAELYFYGRIFGFTPADAIATVPIANLPEPA
ncbi:S9 family peptidase [soil metagenome]